VITYRQLLALLAVARAGSLTLGGVFLRNWNILPEASPPSWFGHTRDVPIRPRQACDETLALRRLTCDEPQFRNAGTKASSLLSVAGVVGRPIPGHPIRYTFPVC